MGFKISGRAQGGLKMIRGGRDTWTGEDGNVDGLQEGLLVGGEQRGGSEEAQVESRRRRRPTPPPPPPPPALGVKRVQSCRRPPCYPALPLTANYGISLDRLPKAAPSSRRGGVSTCRAISIIITLIKVSRWDTGSLPPDYLNSTSIQGLGRRRFDLSSSWFSDGKENRQKK